ncbi:MAG: O-antigen ligase [Saprospiraceae bacterium]|jgi:O-antigen ligase
MPSVSAVKQNSPSENHSVFFVLYFIFFSTLPLVFSEKIIDPVLLPRQIFLTVFTCIVLLIVAIQNASKNQQFDFNFLKKPIPIILTLSLVVSAISISSAIVVSESIYVLSKEAIILVFCLLTTSLLVQKQISTKQLSICVVSFMTVTICIGYYQLWNNGGDLSFVKSTMANKNLLGSALFLCVPFLFNTYRFSIKWKIFTIIIMILLGGVFLITHSKGVIVALAIALISFILLVLFLSPLKLSANFFKTKTTKLIATLTIMILGVGVMLVFQNKGLFGHLFSLNTAYTRINIWENSLKMIQQNPFLGVGAGNWNIHFSKYGLSEFNHLVQNGYTIYQRAHNHFLQTFCEKGIVGVVLFASLFMMILRSSFKTIKRTTDQKEAVFTIAMTGTTLGFLFISLVDYPLERIEHLVLFSVIIAILLSREASQLKKIVNKGKGKILLLFAIIFVLFSLVVSSKRYYAESYLSKIHATHKKAQWGKLLRIAKKIDSKYYEVDPMSIPVTWYVGVAKFSQGDIKAAKKEFELAYRLNPYNIHVLNNLASCYEKEGDHSKAQNLYKNSLDISPDFQESRLNLSAVYFNAGDIENAFQTIDKCPLSCGDDKYHVFLPAILKAKLKLLIANESDNLLVNKYQDILNNSARLNNIYRESKLKSTSFASLIKRQ